MRLTTLLLPSDSDSYQTSNASTKEEYRVWFGDLGLVSDKVIKLINARLCPYSLGELHFFKVCKTTENEVLEDGC